MGTMDIFSQAGFTWNYIMGFTPDPYFEVEIVTQEGKPVKCFNNAEIHPHRAAEDVESTDLIIISSVSDFEPLASNRKAINWLKYHYTRGTTIGSICVGSFLLAETGLLDGKTATTHWGFAHEFQRRYPQIHLRPRQLITDEGNLLCSGSCNSYIDLSVYLIERYCGSNVAVECSKTMIHDYARSSQAPYIVFQHKKDHGDPQVVAVQKLIEENYSDNFDADTIARDHGMSRRTFERRFKKATEDTPFMYIQRVRVEVAKQLLETGFQTFEEISYRVGYEDSNFFRKVFIKHTGLRPKEYKMKFQR
jgi:transcriptional regulator GlxA family with amidase domain